MNLYTGCDTNNHTPLVNLPQYLIRLLFSVYSKQCVWEGPEPKPPLPVPAQSRDPAKRAQLRPKSVATRGVMGMPQLTLSGWV